MPDFWSHHFAAREAYHRFMRNGPKRLRWSESDMALFEMGAQGPDVFYYMNVLNPFSKKRYDDMGNAVHELRVRERMRMGIEQARAHGRYAYLAGYVSHYLMDVACHPLICRLGPDSKSHKRVEIDLDRFCVDAYWHKGLSDLDPNEIKCSKRQLEAEVLPFWRAVLSDIGGADADALDSALLGVNAEMRRVQALLIRRIVDRVPLSSWISKRFHYDISILRYPDPRDAALKAEREYDAYERRYRAGIERTVEAYLMLDAVLDSSSDAPSGYGVDAFMDRFVTADYLGVPLKGAAL